MKFLLDSNVCIAALRRKPWALEALASVSLEDVAVSAITVGELYHGACRSGFPQREAAKVEAFLYPLRILPLGLEEAIQWGRIEALLRTQGNAIEAEDAMIAAITKTHALTLVTSNTRHFERVKGLKLVDWALKPPKARKP
ncbi:MAG: type II toxin-antitoxin system VapC family toxin [Acidobacteriota bacterium]|nr:type II toxin-antitoxin system VapC family toxin [Acidobacteriota bacterium]